MAGYLWDQVSSLCSIMLCLGDLHSLRTLFLMGCIVFTKDALRLEISHVGLRVHQGSHCPTFPSLHISKSPFLSSKPKEILLPFGHSNDKINKYIRQLKKNNEHCFFLDLQDTSSKISRPSSLTGDNFWLKLVQ